MIAPKYPQTNKYWSNRVYNTIGRGGFMIHPYCKDMLEEFEDGVNIVLYKNQKEMFEKIDYYLQNDEEREKIRIAGRDLVRSKYTYKDRVKTICEHLTKKN
jgi:spore maturation protein CgeB